MRSRLLLFVLLTAACSFCSVRPAPPIPLLLLNRSQPRNRLCRQLPRPRKCRRPRYQPWSPTPIPVPTEVPVPPNGQIVFRYEVNLWRYLVDAGSLEQLT